MKRREALGLLAAAGGLAALPSALAQEATRSMLTLLALRTSRRSWSAAGVLSRVA